MNKAQKDLIKEEFYKRFENFKFRVNHANWSMTIKEIEEQESWRRK